MRKKIALLIPHHFSLYQEIIKNLEINGYEIVLLILTDKDFSYKNALERINNFIQKTLFKNKEYKSALRVKRHSEMLIESLNNIPDEIDYALVIRPDYFTKESLIELKKKSNLLTAYQWDGFKRYPNIINYIEIFDRFFVFDQDDYKKYSQEYENIFPITNFYIDCFNKNTDNYNDEVFFLGSYLEERIDEVISISNFFRQQNIETNIQIVYNKSNIPDKLKKSNIKVLPAAKKYAEMLDEINRSKYLLEFQNTNIHNGLSFRVFESIYFKKKLITNNPDVKHYDFYHPNNIFVWEGQNYENIISFLQKDYVEIDPKTFQKYSFTNWIHYIFNENPYQSINFPEN